MNAKLITMDGAAGEITIFDFDPLKMNDFEAGLHFFKVISVLNPGIMLSDIIQNDGMSGWWTDLKHAVGDVKDGIGDVISDTYSLVGRNLSDAIDLTVRTAGDEGLQDAIARGGAAYATGGVSEGIRGFFSGASGGQTEDDNAISKAGAAWKVSLENPAIIGGIMIALIAIVGIAALFGGGKKDVPKNG